MERRTFLKNFAIGLGIVTIVPATISEIIDIKDMTQTESGELTCSLLSNEKGVELIIQKLYAKDNDMNLVEFLNSMETGKKEIENEYTWDLMKEK